MISYEKALQDILERVFPLQKERVELARSLRRFLAADVNAPFDSPRFDNSAVDGFAVKCFDVQSAGPNSPVTLRVSGQVRAGDTALELGSGCAISILTGAPVHASHEAIVMKEFAERCGENVTVFRSVKAGENIRRAGEEYQTGNRILEQGTEITPPVSGVLASVGHSIISVHAIPRVSLIVSGNELAEACQDLREGQIYDSNSAALNSLLQECGMKDVRVIRCADSWDEITEAIQHARDDSDVVVTVGGASVGDFDYVAQAAKAAGFTIRHDKVAIKPGKPNLFGTADRVLFFGLPGNPVSAYVSLLLFVAPALKKMMGARECHNRILSASLSSDLRKKAGRMEFVRVALISTETGLAARPVRGQDSHMMLGLAKADGLLLFDKEKEELTAGEICRVMTL